MNTDKNKSVLSFDNFDDISSDTRDSVQMQHDSLAGGTSPKNPERITKGAAAGCKPGSSRKTYVLTGVCIGKLKAIAGHLGLPEVAIVQNMLDKGIEEYERKYGAAISKLWQSE